MDFSEQLGVVFEKYFGLSNALANITNLAGLKR
jgi:hypothetical protein